MAVEPTALGTLHAEARAAAARVVELARARRRMDLVAPLEAELATPRDAATVVVVAGETKRGKSSLVNALLGRGVLPVAAEVATAAHIVVRYGTPELARVVHAEGPSGEEVPFEELAAWATASGNPGNAKGVRAIELLLDDPLLARGIALVDTPGVGGLDAAHAAVTKAALRTADILLFVVDASAPLARPELGFLGEVTDRIDTVLFALTKRDAFHGWEQILADDRRLLARTRYAEAPFFPVSSTLALEARDLEDEGVARLLLEESGVDELRQALVDLAAGKALALRTVNVVRLAERALERLDALEQAVVAAASGDGGGAAEVEAARARVAAFRAGRRQGARGFEREFRRVGQSVDLELNRSLADLRGRYEAKIADRHMEGLASSLEAEVQAITVTLNGSLADHVADAIHAVAKELQLEGFGDVEVGEFAIGDGRLGDVRRAASGGGALIDALASAAPIYMLGQLGRVATIALLGVGGLAGPIGMLAGGGLGLLLGGAIWTKRRAVQDQQQARAVLGEAVEWARREIGPAVRDQIAALKDALEDELGEALDRHERELAAAVTEAEQVARATVADRGAARDAALERRAQVVQMRGAVASLRARLAGVQPAAEPVAQW